MTMRSRPRERKKKRKAKFSKRVISGVLAAVGVFTAAVLAVFLVTGSEPSTLVACFFAFAGGEAGILGLLRHSENKYGEKKPEIPETERMG